MACLLLSFVLGSALAMLSVAAGAPVPSVLSIQAPPRARWLLDMPGGDAIRDGAMAVLSIAPIRDSGGASPTPKWLVMWRIVPEDQTVYGNQGEWIVTRLDAIEERVSAGKSMDLSASTSTIGGLVTAVALVTDVDLPTAAAAVGLPASALDASALDAPGGKIRISASRAGFEPRKLRLADGTPAVTRSAKVGVSAPRACIALDASVGGAHLSSAGGSTVVAAGESVYAVMITASFIGGTAATPVGLTDDEATRALAVRGVLPRIRVSNPSALSVMEDPRPASPGLEIPVGPFRLVNATSRLAIPPRGWGARVVTGKFPATVTVEIDVDDIEVLGCRVTGSRGTLVIPTFGAAVGVGLAAGTGAEVAAGVGIGDAEYAARSSFGWLSSLAPGKETLQAPVAGALAELVSRAGFAPRRFDVSVEPCTHASAIAIVSADRSATTTTTTSSAVNGAGAVIVVTEDGFGSGSALVNLANGTEAARGPVAGRPGMYRTVCLGIDPTACDSIVLLDAVITAGSHHIVTVTSEGYTTVSTRANDTETGGGYMLHSRGVMSTEDQALVTRYIRDEKRGARLHTPTSCATVTATEFGLDQLAGGAGDYVILTVDGGVDPATDPPLVLVSFGPGHTRWERVGLGGGSALLSAVPPPIALPSAGIRNDDGTLWLLACNGDTRASAVLIDSDTGVFAPDGTANLTTLASPEFSASVTPPATEPVAGAALTSDSLSLLVVGARGSVFGSSVTDTTSTFSSSSSSSSSSYSQSRDIFRSGSGLISSVVAGPMGTVAARGTGDLAGSVLVARSGVDDWAVVQVSGGGPGAGIAFDALGRVVTVSVRDDLANVGDGAVLVERAVISVASSLAAPSGSIGVPFTPYGNDQGQVTTAEAGSGGILGPSGGRTVSLATGGLFSIDAVSAGTTSDGTAGSVITGTVTKRFTPLNGTSSAATLSPVRAVPLPGNMATRRGETVFLELDLTAGPNPTPRYGWTAADLGATVHVDMGAFRITHLTSAPHAVQAVVVRPTASAILSRLNGAPVARGDQPLHREWELLPTQGYVEMNTAASVQSLVVTDAAGKVTTTAAGANGQVGPGGTVTVRLDGGSNGVHGAMVFSANRGHIGAVISLTTPGGPAALSQPGAVVNGTAGRGWGIVTDVNTGANSATVAVRVAMAVGTYPRTGWTMYTLPPTHTAGGPNDPWLADSHGPADRESSVSLSVPECDTTSIAVTVTSAFGEPVSTGGLLHLDRGGMVSVVVTVDPPAPLTYKLTNARAVRVFAAPTASTTTAIGSLHLVVAEASVLTGNLAEYDPFASGQPVPVLNESLLSSTPSAYGFEDRRGGTVLAVQASRPSLRCTTHQVTVPLRVGCPPTRRVVEENPLGWVAVVSDRERGTELTGYAFHDLPCNYRPPSELGRAVPTTDNYYNADPSAPRGGRFAVSRESGRFKQCEGAPDRNGCGCTEKQTISQSVADSDCIVTAREVFFKALFVPRFRVEENGADVGPLREVYRLVEVNGRTDYCFNVSSSCATGDREALESTLLSPADFDAIVWNGEELYHFRVEVLSDSYCNMTTEFTVWVVASPLQTSTWYAIVSSTAIGVALALFFGYYWYASVKGTLRGA